jgi:hypothetical protein
MEAAGLLAEAGDEHFGAHRVHFGTDAPLAQQIAQVAVAAAVGFVEDYLGAATQGLQTHLSRAGAEVEEVAAR